MSEMVERVARSLNTYFVSRWDSAGGVCWLVYQRKGEAVSTYGQYSWEDDARTCCLEMNARAAIKAMGEPTAAMKLAGEEAMGREGAHDCEVHAPDIFTAMIDSALQ